MMHILRGNNLPQFILALIVTTGFFFCLYILLRATIPQENKEVLYTMLGFLGNQWVVCIAFFFSSSVGSVSKDKVIGDIAGNKGTGGSTTTMKIPDAGAVEVKTTQAASGTSAPPAEKKEAE